jgi:hypothetical protein
MRFRIPHLHRPHPATALAAAALFLAAGGPAAAVDTANAGARLITGKQVKNNSIDSRDIKDGSLTAKDFKKGVLGQAGSSGSAGSNGAPGANGTPRVGGRPRRAG